MDTIFNLIADALLKVVTSFAHNWPFLVISIVISVLLRLYLDANKTSKFLLRHQRAGVLGATAVAVTTPLCSCGTTAVVLGMMASMLPWAPIVAFMVASPLTSPEELVYSAGLFGWPFAWAFFISSILLGLLGGLAAGIMEKRGWLVNQARMSATDAGVDRACPSLYPLPQGAREQQQTMALQSVQKGVEVRQWEFSTVGGLTIQPESGSTRFFKESGAVGQRAGGCGCEESGRLCSKNDQKAGNGGCLGSPQKNQRTQVEEDGCGCTKDSAQVAPACGCGNPYGTAVQAQPSGCGCAVPISQAQGKPRVSLRMFWNELFTTGKRLLIMFTGFAFIGYLLNGLIPAAWVAAVFGKGNIYSIPLAATLGLPLYINTEGSLPLVRALIDGGMSQGAALAFLITGAGTSFGAIAGALTIARWRVIGLVIGTLWVGAVLAGTLYNFLLAAGLV
jgi:uncharacterized membrane protein YraQ (UPF0718 family)